MHIFVAPHPPIILPEIGRGEEQKAAATIAGMKRIAGEIAALKPKTIAVVTPHGHAFRDALCVSVERDLTGDFGQFGFPRLKFSFTGSEKAVDFCDALEEAGIQAVALDRAAARQYQISTHVDHGALVPLSFILNDYSDFELLHIGMGFLTKEATCAAGRILAELLDESDVLLFSGDLSHRLLPESGSGYDKQGAVYDALIVNAVKNKHYGDILEVSEDLLEHAGQCAQRPFEMMVGALDGYETETEVYSYEGPYGVGYMTAHIIRGVPPRLSSRTSIGTSAGKYPKRKAWERSPAFL